MTIDNDGGRDAENDDYDDQLTIAMKIEPEKGEVWITVRLIARLRVGAGDCLKFSICCVLKCECLKCSMCCVLKRPVSG